MQGLQEVSSEFQCTKDRIQRLDMQLKASAAEKLVSGARALFRNAHSTGPTGLAAVCCSYVVGAEYLWDKDAKAMRFAMDQHHSLVRHMLPQYKGFLCQMDDYTTVTVFPDIRSCIGYSVALQVTPLPSPEPPKISISVANRNPSPLPPTHTTVKQ